MAALTYFLPCALKSALEHETAQSLTVTEETAEIDGFKVPGYALAGAPEDLLAFVMKATLDFGLHQVYAATEEQTLFARDTILIGGEPRARLAARTTVMRPMEVTRRDLKKLEPLIEDLQQTLTMLSDYSGVEFLLDLRDGGFAPIQPRAKDKHVTVVLGASAPGEVIKQYATHCCDIELMLDGSEIELNYGPSSGTGVIVQDDGKYPIGQVVQNSLFLFVPIDVRFVRILRERDGLGLFKKALRYVWNAYVENAAPEAPAPFASADEYADAVEEWLDFYPSTMRAMIEHAERDAEELYRRYQAKRRYIEILKAGRSEGIVLHQGYDPDQARADWDRLSQDPRLQSFGRLDKGFQAVTRPIVCEFDGKRYQLGTYHLRISITGNVSVWSEQSTHPSGVPHPHIGWSGSPCFGNLSLAIEQAAIRRRYADTIDLVLRWLTEGYEPSLADTPITEWPEEAEV